MSRPTVGELLRLLLFVALAAMCYACEQAIPGTAWATVPLSLSAVLLVATLGEEEL